ncbi:META domain-containing protein [uncultured Shimia sp.]|uniref:META domain-containing protein n=1 Tax=uncultured Shimia sp. TaxID=573152 RepID=UPI0026177BEE|nr:META domain-containing protein [uncultured Shimia sp.]
MTLTTIKSAGVGAGLVMAMCLSAGSAMADFQNLQGSVLYREKIALPPEALVEVTLEDVSKMDVKSTVLASQTLKPAGQVPVDFQLSYDDAMVEARGRYSVRAVIRVGEDVLWRSTQSFPALTYDAPETVDVVVERMVKRDATGLSGSNWLVAQINGQVVEAAQGPLLQFGSDGQVSGTSGCNRFSGGYTATGGQLEFGPLATTRMACPGPLDQQEKAFFQALSKVVGFEVRDGIAVLLDAEGTEQMQLIAE